MWLNRDGRTGFTLLEVAVAVLIFAVGLLAVVGACAVTLQLMEDSQGIVQAVADGRFVMEQIRSEVRDAASFNAVRNRTAAQWDTWAGNFGLNNLDGEQIQVLSGPAGADPWPVSVEVRWRQAANRWRQTTLSTLMTYRQ